MENDEIKYKKDIPLEWLKMPSSAKEKELPILEIIESLDYLISILEQKGWEVFFENYVLSNSLLSSLPLNKKIRLSK